MDEGAVVDAGVEISPVCAAGCGGSAVSGIEACTAVPAVTATATATGFDSSPFDHRTVEEPPSSCGSNAAGTDVNPGSRYTVNVLARDAAGAVSWASPPLTVTTGSPAASTCAVRLSSVTDWSSGFVGAVDITNTGTQPVADWTLTFDWPTGLQQVSSGWNATWAQTGRTVTVTGSARIEPNATVGAGFVGNYTGPNIPPAAFTLNGNLCQVREN